MTETLIKNKIILKILDNYKSIWSLGHLTSLGNWDLNTYMPPEGVEARGMALGKTAVLSQRLFLDKKFVSSIKKASLQTGLNDYEKGVVRVLKHFLNFYQKLPPKFIEEFSKVTTEGFVAWKNAKEKNKFSIFEPYLSRIVELSRKKTEYLGYKKHPYDALLDEYEEGLTTNEVEKYFNEIKKPLINLLNYVKNSKKYKTKHELEYIRYETARMENFNRKILKLLHYNMNHIRMDVSPHPFMTMIGKGDVRITTRYEGKDFAESYGSTLHEYGHALYDLQSREELHYTPIAGGSSLIMHESQSRFWENFIGKSKEFLKLIYKDIIEINPKFRKYSVEEVYRYMNLVKPGLIRVEADELTYHFHVMIRFEIEKALIEGKINVRELPQFWNRKYQEYLGLKVPDYSSGVLQDVHWSNGNVGYFPTYSLGTILSTMWKYKLEKNVDKISELVKNTTGVRKIQDWLRKHVHQYGSTFVFKELVKKTCGEDFNSRYFIEYLNRKYKELY